MPPPTKADGEKYLKHRTSNNNVRIAFIEMNFRCKMCELL